ncbi:MAG: response regulator [Deltaproteobacteria bacterium]|nr:response regulator [Deltaproteobacteria bacterium]MBW2355396.1 response regulator [Deltaproteobacteria bacterium]
MIENVKIIVISPEALIRDFVVDVLEFSVNRNVVGVDSAAEALARIDAEGKVDIVVCAEELPDMPGRSLLARVKRKHPQSIGVLLTSGADDPAGAADSSVDAYLNSPTDTRALFDLVQRFVVDAEKR